MTETGPARRWDSRRGASYVSQWNRFVAWSEASGRSSLPASPEDVADYLEERRGSGAKPSTLKVAAAAIARSHKELGFDSPLQAGVARTVLNQLARDEAPVPNRALPLDLDCYQAIRKTAHEPRGSRGGRLERVSTACRRGAIDLAMIGLMRDARLRVSEAAVLTWGDVERVSGGTGRVRVAGAEEVNYRTVGADTMKLLSAIRRDAADDEMVLGLRPNQIARRIDATARQAGLGEGYSGESPRLGMIGDLQDIGVLLLTDYLLDKER